MPMLITPSTGLLKSLRSRNPDYTLLVGEGIDNSFDANAKRVDVVFSDDRITIKDDGLGLDLERIPAIVCIGEHAEHATTALGRYGIGIKYQSIAAGDILEIRSIHAAGRATLIVNWAEIEEKKKWEIESPDVAALRPGDKTGATVIIRGLRGQKLTPARMQSLRDEVAFRFHPALAHGKIITINGAQIEKFSDPRLTEVVEETLYFDGAREARVRAGILVDPKSKIRQVHISYRHRVIVPRSSLGCNGVVGPFFARVELVGPWVLSEFKNDISDADKDILEPALYRLLQPILDKVQTRGMAAAVRELTDRLNQMLPPDLAWSRPNRKKKIEDISQGRKKPRQNNETSDAVERDNGPARLRKPRTGVTIAFDEPLYEQHGYGVFDGTGHPKVIKLARDCPRIASLVQRRNQESERALLDIAMFLFAQAANPDQMELIPDFGLRVCRLTEQQEAFKEAAE